MSKNCKSTKVLKEAESFITRERERKRKEERKMERE
jgi:hypothetical protein